VNALANINEEYIFIVFINLCKC